jgi:ABC-type uncharacterized transport system permease subunit
MALLSRVQDTFAIPHTFKPRLGFLDALVATLASLCRIFLGSLLFALVGVLAMRTASAMPNAVLGILVVIPFLVVFVVLLSVLLRAISSIQDRLSARFRN